MPRSLIFFQSVAEAVQCPEQRVRAIQWAADEELKQWDHAFSQADAAELVGLTRSSRD